MRPVLFEVFEQPIHAYTFFMSVGFLAATLLCVREAERLKEPLYLPTQHAVWLFLGGLIGAKVFFILQYRDLTDVWRAVRIWEGGLVWYGGLIGAVVAAFIVMYLLKMPYVKVVDAVIAYVPLGHAFGRFGCFMNGCCWGDPTHAPWALRFPRNSLPFRNHVEERLLAGTEPSSLPVHPTQLYSVFGLLALFFCLRYVLRNKPFDGAVILLYMGLYGAMRFVVEAFRGDTPDDVLGVFTVSQLVSISLVLAAGGGFALYYWGYRGRSRDVTDEPAAT